MTSIAVSPMTTVPCTSQLGPRRSTCALEAAESRLQTANRATVSRIEALEQTSTDNQALVQQVSANMAALQEQFEAAKTWLEGLELDTLAEHTKNAEARSQAIVDGYLEWAKSQRAILDEQIKAIESGREEKTPATDDTSEGTGE